MADKPTQESRNEAGYHRQRMRLQKQLGKVVAERDLERKMLEQERILRDELVEALRDTDDLLLSRCECRDRPTCEFCLHRRNVLTPLLSRYDAKEEE